MNKNVIFFLLTLFLLCCSVSTPQQSTSTPQQNLFNTSAKTVDELCKDNCCKASLGAVKEYSYLVLGTPRDPTVCPEDAEKNKIKCVTSCPEGTTPVMMKCMTSLRTCIPKKTTSQ